MAKTLREQQDAGIILMWCIGLSALLVLIFACTAHAEEDFEPVMICNAIFHAEGGAKAQYLYGIRSVHYADFKEARQICLNTVRNNRKRWVKAGKPGDFLSFLAGKYCPLSDPRDVKGLNKNWLKNVKFWLNKKAVPHA